MIDLSVQQSNFVDEFVDTEKPIESYLTAYGCKRSTAKTACYALLKKPNISAKIAEIRERRAKLRDNKSAMSPDRLLQEEQRLSTSTLGDIVDSEGEFIPLHKLPEDLQRALSGVDVEDTILQVTEGEVTTETRLKRRYKYRLWDKGKSLERGERHLGMFEKDNQQHSQAPVININYAGREGAEHQRIYELVMDNLYLLPVDFQKLIAPAIPQDKTPTLPDPIPPTAQLPQDAG